MPYLDVPTQDGRVLEVLTEGDPDAFPWLFHSGSPSAAVAYAPIADAAQRLGLWMITYSRPGYGGSTPRLAEQGPPRMVDDVTDSVAVLDSLGVDDFVTLGWSGGGPRALACGALLPERCRAVATLAGVAPRHGAGLDWFAGMASENVAEYTAAEAGPVEYADHMTREFLPILDASVEDLATALGGLLTPVDVAALDPAYTVYLLDSFRRAGAQGVVGIRDDGLAAVAPWGFDLASIKVPVSVWQGRADAMVPYLHGAWLVAHVPEARAHLFDDEGHLSLIARIEEILTDLNQLGGVNPDS